MSRYGRNVSLSRHRSWNATETSPLQPLEESETVILPRASPASVRYSADLSDISVSTKNKMPRKRGRKALWTLSVVLLVIFVLEWRYLYSLRNSMLSNSKLSSGRSTPAFSERKENEGPSRPTYERLLSLAAHALAEGDSKQEPDELWKEPIMGSSQWRPCADNRADLYSAPPESKQSSGYIVVDGGLNQQRVICNAVSVARLLIATLVLPQFLVSSVWKDASQFEGINEMTYFVNYLKDDVHVLSELPVELQSLDLAIMGSIASGPTSAVALGVFLQMTNADIPKEFKPSFFVEMVLPILHRNRVVHLYGFENALSFDPIPFDIQTVLSLQVSRFKFKPHIREAGNYDQTGGEPEKQELEAYRMIHFPTLSKYQGSGKSMSAAELRAVGSCPLTPEEAVFILASLEFKRRTRSFLAEAHIYGGQERVAAITNLYPNLVTKEDLLSPEELAPFVNHSSQIAALDFIGCAVADAFAMTDSGSQLASLASGYRI